MLSPSVQWAEWDLAGPRESPALFHVGPPPARAPAPAPGEDGVARRLAAQLVAQVCDLQAAKAQLEAQLREAQADREATIGDLRAAAQEDWRSNHALQSQMQVLTAELDALRGHLGVEKPPEAAPCASRAEASTRAPTGDGGTRAPTANSAEAPQAYRERSEGLARRLGLEAQWRCATGAPAVPLSARPHTAPLGSRGAGAAAAPARPSSAAATTRRGFAAPVAASRVEQVAAQGAAPQAGSRPESGASRPRSAASRPQTTARFPAGSPAMAAAAPAQPRRLSAADEPHVAWGRRASARGSVMVMEGVPVVNRALRAEMTMQMKAKQRRGLLAGMRSRLGEERVDSDRRLLGIIFGPELPGKTYADQAYFRSDMQEQPTMT